MAMLFQKINQDSADKVFITCKNGLTTQIAIGTPVCFDSTTDNNGNTVIEPTTATLRMFAGIVTDRIMGTSGQPDQYQKVQVYGYNPAIMMGATSVTPGAPMIAGNALTYMRPALLLSASTVFNYAVNEAYAYVVAATTYNTPAATYIATVPGYIRAM